MEPATTSFDQLQHAGPTIELSPLESANTTEDAVRQFLCYLEAAGRSPTTISTYRQTLSRVVELLGNPVLVTITPGQIDLALLHLAGLGSTGGPRCSVVTLNRVRSTLRSFFRWAEETGRTAWNPARYLRRSQAESAPTLPIEGAEVERLLATIRCSGEGLSVRDEALFATYAFTGLRRAEVLRLRIADHDPERRTLFVRSGKGLSPRLVPVPRCLALPLAAQRTRPGPRAGHIAPLFPGRTGRGPLGARQVQMRFDHWKAAAGLRPALTLHSFRAGFATRLYEATGDLALVSRALGHRDLRTTLRYIHTTPFALQSSIDAMLS